MKTPKHTKTPWVALRTIWVDPTSTEHRDQWIIKRDNPELDRPGEYVADLCGLEPEVQGLAKANAEVIVRAVNAHEALVEALEALMAAAPAHRSGKRDGATMGRISIAMDKAEAALRAARGEK